MISASVDPPSIEPKAENFDIMGQTAVALKAEIPDTEGHTGIGPMTEISAALEPTATDPKAVEPTMVNPSPENAQVHTQYKLLENAKETLDGSKNHIVQAMCREGIFKEEHLKGLRKLGTGA